MAKLHCNIGDCHFGLCNTQAALDSYLEAQQHYRSHMDEATSNPSIFAEMMQMEEKIIICAQLLEEGLG
jgi:hypothetical protein